MKEKDLKIIKEHWENMETVSLRDRNLQELERKTIIDFIEKTNRKTIKDIGCGDGSDTIYFAKEVQKVFAYDYSDAMLEKASKTLKDVKNVNLNKLNILEDSFEEKTDIAITKRMLINLGNFDNQKKAIKKIYDSLNSDGYYIMLETSIDGLDNLNELRETFKYPKIPEPFHNTLFKLDILKDFLKDFFIVEDIKYFSTYFFLTRVYNLTLDEKEENVFKYDINAKQMAMGNVNLFEENIIGPQFCMLLKKRD